MSVAAGSNEKLLEPGLRMLTLERDSFQSRQREEAGASVSGVIILSSFFQALHLKSGVNMPKASGSLPAGTTSKRKAASAPKGETSVKKPRKGKAQPTDQSAWPDYFKAVGQYIAS